MVAFEDISSGLCFLDKLSHIEITTNSEYLTVYLDGGSLFDEKLYSIGGKVSVYGLDKIVKKYMLKNGLQYKQLALVATEPYGSQAHIDLTVLYSSRMTICDNIDGFVSNFFLSSQDIRRIYPGQDISVWLFSPPTGGAKTTLSPKIDFNATDKSGRRYHGSYSLGQVSAAMGTHKISVKFSDVLSKARLLSPTADITSFTLSEGKRSMTCFIDKSLAKSSEFFFTNKFGVKESVAFPLHTTIKTTMESSTATVNGVSTLYDRHSTREHEAEFGPLTRDEALAAEDFVLSEEVTYQGRKILITNFTFEIPDSPEKMHTVKFTWRYPEDTPDTYLHGESGVFTREYDYNFS